MRGASMPEYDVLVVGAGPSGSVCASYCAIKGLKTLLVDKACFPRDKICGDALSGMSISILKDLNALPEIEKVQHAKVNGVIFGNENTDVLIPFLKKGQDYWIENNQMISTGYCCKRILSDNAIYQTAKKYCKTLENFEVKSLEYKSSEVIVRGILKDSEYEVSAEVVIGADGAYSTVAKQSGLYRIDYEHHCTAVRCYYKNVKDCRNTIEIYFLEDVIPGYFWIFPVGDNEANVGLGMITSEMKKRKLNLGRLLEEIIKKEKFSKRFNNAEKVGELKGWTLPFGSQIPKIQTARTLLIGDAAHLVDPFTGEGQGTGMHSGKIAAEVCAKAKKLNDFSEKTLSEYEERVRQTIGKNMDLSYKLQKLGRIKPLLNLVLSKASRSERVRNTISGMITNFDSRKELTNPLFYLDLLFA